MSLGGSIFLVSAIWIIMAVIVIYLLDYFGDKNTFAWYTRVTTFTSFFIAFTIIIMLPIDIASTNYKHCLEVKEDKSVCDEPLINIPRDALFTFWQIFYWVSFTVQMFFGPIMQGYCKSGAFSKWKRFKDGIMENVYFYAALGAPCLFFVLYAIFGAGVDAGKLLDLAIPLMNSFGLILLVLLMSYGLVEIPRGLWFESSIDWNLRCLECKAPALKESCVDTEAEMYEVAGLLALASTKIPASDPLRPNLEKILEKCPLALNERHHVPAEEHERFKVTETSLAALHARIKRAEFVNRREQAKLKSLYQKAFFYQDIINNRTNRDRIFDSPFWGVTIPEFLLPYKTEIQRSAWWWYVCIQPIAMKCLGVVCLTLTLLIVWSESTFQFSGSKLSIPAHILDKNNSHFTIEVLSVAFLCYMSTCTYSSLLKLKLFDFFEIVGDHMTDEPSLLFAGAYSCKLTFPLMYNYLNMGGVTSEPGKDENWESLGYPVFIQYLGPAVNMTPLLGEGYNDWIAFLILIVCCIFALNLHNRIAKLFGSKHYFLESLKDGNGDPEGRQIIESARAAELRKMARQENTSGRNTATRSRNAADLLARYQNRANETQESLEDRSKTTRTFGKLGFGSSSKNGYQRVD